MAFNSSGRKSIGSVLERGPLALQLESMRLSKIAANVLKPVLDELGFGALASGENIRITRERIREKDKDPYGIDPQEDPFANYREITMVEILCPTNGHISKLKQVFPRMLSRLQARGFCSVNLTLKLAKPKPATDNFLKTGPLRPIPKNEEASQLAQDLANRLSSTSPLKKPLQELAEALKPKSP